MIVKGLQDAQNVVSECFLIKLEDRFPPSAAEQLKRLLQKVNGKILLEVGGGGAFIVLAPTTYRSLFESLPYIESFGGVNLTPRKIRRITVQESPQGELRARYVVQNNQIIRLEQ